MSTGSSLSIQWTHLSIIRQISTTPPDRTILSLGACSGAVLELQGPDGLQPQSCHLCLRVDYPEDDSSDYLSTLIAALVYLKADEAQDLWGSGRGGGRGDLLRRMIQEAGAVVNR